MVQDEIETEEELTERKNLIEKIIDRLTYQDQIFIPLTKNIKTSEDDDDPVLVVHPNYVIDV